MSHRPPRVSQPDIARALRAAKQTGLNVRVDIYPDGKISLVPITGEEENSNTTRGQKIERKREIVL